MNLIESISFIIEQYVLRSSSSISRVYDPSGRVVNSRPISTYDGPTLGIIRGVDNTDRHSQINNDRIRREMLARRIYRFKSNKNKSNVKKSDN